MQQFFKIKFWAVLLAILVTTTGYAQYMNFGDKNQSGPKQSPWFVGGMVGGSFSNYGGSFEVSPLVGYKITDNFHVGSRLTYIYSSYDYGGTFGKKSFHDYGGSLFARHVFLRMLFAHVEYEVLSVELYDQYTNERRTINSLFVGGGLYQSMGGRGFATIAILYNLLETQYSPYSNPVIRIGFGIGL